MAVLFTSDVHLTGERPDTIALFIEFLGAARDAEALYILGDLFEAWLGDDLVLPDYVAPIEALRRLAADVPVHVMHGNRDFLLGKGFEALSGCTLIEEPTLITLAGQPTLLLHGDGLCTDDVEHQAVRRQVRDPQWQQMMLAKPPEERIAIARAYRAQSVESKGTKAAGIMDVNEQAVWEALKTHGATRMIHGHTHRPAVHALDGGRERMVLDEWHADRGSYIICNGDRCQLRTWRRGEVPSLV